MKPEIIYTEGPEGLCPVQAEGTIDGFTFYFRSRWDAMSLHVASEKGLDPLEDLDAWHIKEKYGDWSGSASYAPKADCIAFIERAAEFWRNRK